MMLSTLLSDHRRLALAAALCAAPLASGAAQTIGLNAGATGNTVIAPNGKLTVPIIVDMSAAGGLTLGGLQSGLSWSPARLTLDSIRAAVVPGWTFAPNTAGAGGGTSVFAAFGSPGIGATTTIANAYFTASASTGGTRISLQPTAGASDVGANLTNALRPRSLDVCVGAAALWGDVNDDGVVNISDAQQVGRFSVGLSVVNLAALLQRGDVTANGTINISDAQQIARFSVGLPASPRLGTSVPATGVPTGITVNPSAAQTLVVGSSRQVNSVPVNGATDLSGCASVAWSSNNVAVATVNSTGYVTGVAAGAANITASSGGFSASVTFNVTNVPVASVNVALAPTAIQVGTTATATATTRDAANNVLVGRVVTFSSSNTSVATVNPTTGVVSGVAAGTATIFATSEGITGSAVVTVTTGIPTATVTVALGQNSINAGATTTATATPRDAGNNILAGKTVTWSSSNTGVATVNPTTGLVTGVAGGSANIIATIDGIQGQATINVAGVPVAAVTVTLTSPSITVGATTQAIPVLRDAANNILTGRVISFTSSNSAVATVGTFTGVVTGVSAGTATIFVTSEGITGQATVTVTAPMVASTVEVALGSSNIQSGATTTAVATLRDAGNNVISGPVTWSSSAPSIASVGASTGIITGLAAGNATIVGTSGGVTGQANLTITTVPVATVSVNLSPSSVTVGGTSAGTATTRDADGNTLTERPITWSSSNSSVATVNSTTGVVTGVAPGTATIRATSENRIGTASISVGLVPVASVSVTLGSSTIAPGGTTNATAVTRSSTNAVLTGRTVTWSSSNTSRATVNATTGVVTAVSAGTVNIIATSEGVTGQATLTVGTVTVTTVTVALSQGTITPGSLANATAVLRDASGNVISGPSVTWSSSNTAVATVNSTTGAITGVSVGTATIRATSGSATGTTSITVAIQVSHEPPGMTALGEKAMDCIKPTACEPEWRVVNESYPGGAAAGTDPTAPTSPPNVFVQVYKPALPGGSSPVAVVRDFPTHRQTVYAAFTLKLSENFQAHTSGVNKKLHFFIANGRNMAVFIIRGSGTTGTLVPAFLIQALGIPMTYTDLQGRTKTSTQQNLDSDPAVCTTVRGRWHRYEMVLVGNTPGVSDGSVAIWMDGKKCIEVGGIGFAVEGANNKWQEVMWSPTWGGVNDKVLTEFYEYGDHLYVSGK